MAKGGTTDSMLLAEGRVLSVQLPEVERSSSFDRINPVLRPTLVFDIEGLVH